MTQPSKDPGPIPSEAEWRERERRAALAHPEETCQRCLGPNVWSWHAPSPLWNAVLRSPATGEDDWSILCPPCFAEIAELSGIVPRGRHTWHFAPEGFSPDGLWTDPDGRRWDPDRCLWVAPSDPGAEAMAERPGNPWHRLVHPRLHRAWEDGYVAGGAAADRAQRCEADRLRICEAVEAEWYNGNISEDVRDRILQVTPSELGGTPE